MVKLVVASKNRGKIEEIKTLLSNLPIEVLSLEEYPEISQVHEDGKTYGENAKKKALVVASSTGEISLADDSGLEVFALGGKPGMRSSTFDRTDRLRNLKLLHLLEGVPMERRGARFVCAIALARPDGEVRVVEGSCEGFISFEMRGEGGFGYDPIFIVPKYKKTFAELGPKAKNRVSHRARAMKKARKILLEWGLFGCKSRD
jgi:XTP/dITP diphosphohydrolase